MWDIKPRLTRSPPDTLLSREGPRVTPPNAARSGCAEISVRFWEHSEWGANHLGVVPAEAQVLLCSVPAALPPRGPGMLRELDTQPGP